MKASFRFGIHPGGMKEASMDAAYEPMPVPDKVYIPVSQHIGAPCTPCVEAGAYVKAGTLIALANGFVSANVHSSVSGKVLGTEMREVANGRKARHIVIENDGQYTEENLPVLDDPTPEQIVARCKEAGIVGMGGATFPTHVKLSPKNKIINLIINGAECEPYITADYRLMLEHPKEVWTGIALLKKALGAEVVSVGIEDNKPAAVSAMADTKEDADAAIYPLKTKYPQGGEKQLIYAITRIKVPNGGLPGDVGVSVSNVATAYAVYEAVCLGRPSYARYMTVSGGGIAKPSNLYVRVGTPFSALVEHLGVKEDYVKAVSGGTMMGISLDSLTPVTTKGSSSLLLLTAKEIRSVEPTPCINCARCHAVCPMFLMPMKTDAYVLRHMIKESANYHPMSCIECGCCAYVCPAKRPLVQSQRLAKKLIKEGKA